MERFDTARLLRVVLLSAIGLVVAGCATNVPTSPSPAPELQFLGAGELELPANCVTRSGAVYRVAYTVETDGRTADVESEGDDGCVQQALRRWVSSFRYAPPATGTPAVIDWMSVTARRGS